MKGTVISAIGTPKPHDFRIKGEDDKIYFAHLGDIENNEDKLYDKVEETIYLEKEDKVEFKPIVSREPRAIHVVKINPIK